MEHATDAEAFIALDRICHLGNYVAPETARLTATVVQLWNRNRDGTL